MIPENCWNIYIEKEMIALQTQNEQSKNPKINPLGIDNIERET